MFDLQKRTQAKGERISSYLSCFEYIVSRFSKPPPENELLTIAYRNLLPEYRHAMADKIIESFKQLERLGRLWERKKEIDMRYALPAPAERMRVPGGAYNPSARIKLAALESSDDSWNSEDEAEVAALRARQQRYSRREKSRLASSEKQVTNTRVNTVEQNPEVAKTATQVNVQPSVPLSSATEMSQPLCQLPVTYDSCSHAATMNAPYRQWYQPVVAPTVSAAPIPANTAVQDNSPFVGACFTCRAVGHRASACPDVVCHYCKQSGHTIRFCPTRPVMRLECQWCSSPGVSFMTCTKCAPLREKLPMVRSLEPSEVYTWAVTIEGYTATMACKAMNELDHDMIFGMNFFIAFDVDVRYKRRLWRANEGSWHSFSDGDDDDHSHVIARCAGLSILEPEQQVVVEEAVRDAVHQYRVEPGGLRREPSYRANRANGAERATPNATQEESLAGILQEMEADMALQGVEPDPTTTEEKLSKLETELLRMAEDSTYVPPFNAREQFHLENAVVRESMKPGAPSLFVRLADLYEGATMCRRNAMHQKLQPAAGTTSSVQIEPVLPSNATPDQSVSQRDEPPILETDNAARQLCAAAAEARKNAIETPMEEDTATSELLQQPTEMQIPDNAQPLRQPHVRDVTDYEHMGAKPKTATVPNDTIDQAQPTESNKPVQVVQPMPSSNENTDNASWAAVDPTNEARAMDWEDEPRSTDDPTLTLRPIQGESTHAIDEIRTIGGRRNNPRRNLELSDYVSAHLPSRSPSPELFGPNQLVRREASSSRGSNGYQDPQPSRIRHDDGSVGRLRGVKFGGLTPIRTDYSVDPPDFACFNCWFEGHNAIACPRPREQYCYNCGRSGVYVTNCPRCSEAHRTRQRQMPRVAPTGYSPRRPYRHEDTASRQYGTFSRTITVEERHQSRDNPPADNNRSSSHVVAPLSIEAAPIQRATPVDGEAACFAVTLIDGTRNLSLEAREAIFRSVYGIGPPPSPPAEQ
ncbi:unnamed protein product [Trichogramma brassicae]|uniref:CCHC-type domain-containing protein n=1 Tax=Trichogramma brassicae TaxID=86971 RepID=A0A6H5HZB9_9HYME|nr:unnamed protein product [Trichogramma brassicae]